MGVAIAEVFITLMTRMGKNDMAGVVLVATVEEAATILEEEAAIVEAEVVGATTNKLHGLRSQTYHQKSRSPGTGEDFRLRSLRWLVPSGSPLKL